MDWPGEVLLIFEQGTVSHKIKSSEVNVLRGCEQAEYCLYVDLLSSGLLPSALELHQIISWVGFVGYTTDRELDLTILTLPRR